MSHHRSLPLSLFLALLLAVAACGPQAEEGVDAAGEQAQERIAELEEELAGARDQVAALEEDNQALEDELAALEAAATEEDEDAGDEPDAGATPDLDGVADIRTAEGLIDQLRVHLRDPDATSDVVEGWEPGTTGWAPYEVPEAVKGPYDTPGAVVAALATETGAPLLGVEQWETTIRVLLDDDDPDLAYGAVLGWGFLDDAVVGRDIRITLTRTDDDRWLPGGAEQRQHCLRGVSDDGELCV